jgi:hypothetical protein
LGAFDPAGEHCLATYHRLRQQRGARKGSADACQYADRSVSGGQAGCQPKVKS